MNFLRNLGRFSVLLAISMDFYHGLAANHSKRIQSGTVPMQLLDNRVFVQLRLIGPGGVSRDAIFWVDSGGDMLILGKRLANDLGLKPVGRSAHGNMGNNFQSIEKPKIYLASMPLDLGGVSVAANTDSDEILPGVKAEGFFPATLLKRYNVVLNYPARRFTLAEPGVLHHHGVAVPASIQPKNGFIRILITVDGNRYGFMLDTGAAYSGVSRRLVQHWLTNHPAWPNSMGAVGAPNMIGSEVDVRATLVRIPHLIWGPFSLENIGMVGHPARWYAATSQDMTAPIVGAIGGNVLRIFRLEIDYQHSVTYLEKSAEVNGRDLDAVGVILRAQPNGTFIISGVAAQDQESAFVDVRPGDRLLVIDGWSTTGASLAAVLRALQGKVGEGKTLEIERGSKVITVKMKVSAHP